MTTQAKQIARYYDHFRRYQVTFSPDVIRVTGLIPEEVHLKFGDSRLRCTVQSISMIDAVLMVPLGPTPASNPRLPKGIVMLRLSFTDEEGLAVPFFIRSKLKEAVLQQGTRMRLVTVTFLQKPPDFFILTLGKVIEANLASERRKEERVLINEITGKALGLIEGGQRAAAGSTRKSCIIRDLSFSGATILLETEDSYKAGSRISLELRMEGAVLEVPAEVLWAENVLGRTDFQALGLQFDVDCVPVEYKTRLIKLLKVYGTGGNQALFEQEKIADALVRTGVVNREQAEAVLKRQRAGDRRTFGHIAIEMNLIDDRALFRYIADLQ